MTRINQLVRNTQRKGRFMHSRQIYLVTQTRNQYQPVRSNRLHLLSTNTSRTLPVRQRIAVPPSSVQTMGLPQLIPQIHTHHSLVMFVPLGKSLGTLKKHIFWELPTPPQSISVIIRTAPLRGARMIIQNNHQTHFSQDLNSNIEYLHTSFSYQLRICSQVF